MFKNWKTTICGIATILYGVKTIITTGDLNTSWHTIVAGVGLLLSKDFNVSGK